MDVVSHFGLKQPLFRFAGSDGLFASSAYVAARAELVAAAHACETPIVLSGASGMGKSVLINDVSRELAASGVRSAVLSNPALAPPANAGNLGALLVDEADSAGSARLAEIAGAARQQGTTLIVAAIDAGILPAAARRVRLRPMSARQACDFLLDAAARAGRPDLFSAAAQDAIVHAAHGNPRVLKMLANGAVLEAMFEGGTMVSARHVAAAVAAKAPLPGPPSDETATIDEPPPTIRLATIFASADAEIRLPEPESLEAERETDWQAEQDVSSTEHDEMPVPMFVPIDEPRRRFGGDARGVIVGAAALVLLVAGAGVYAADRIGVSRLAAMAGFDVAPDRPAVIAQDSSATAAPDPSASLPGAETVAAPEFDASQRAAVAPAAATPAAVPPAADVPATDTAAGDAADTAEAPVAWPPLPTPGTPGYRPPQPSLPTIAAAARAGIPTNDGAPPSRAKALPSAPLSLGSTGPIDGPAAGGSRGSDSLE